MNNILLVHIGRPKTGTTALQFFLYENGENLERYNWTYPNLNEELPDIYPYPTIKQKNGVIFYKKRRIIDTTTVNWNRVWERVLRHLEKNNVIISVEELFWFDTEIFLEGAKAKYDNVKVILYLRRQDRAIESDWNQYVKSQYCLDKTFQEFLGTEEAKRIIEHSFYYEKIRRISNIVGRDNLILRVYEKQQFGGKNHTIISDFLSSINVNSDLDAWNENRILNPKLSGNYLEIKRVFNTILADLSFDERRQYAAVFRELGKTHINEERGYFTQKERELFLEQFATDNEKIAKDYLHRKDGILFYDNKMDYSLYDAYQCSPFEEDLIKTFATIICTKHGNIQTKILRNEIQRLRKQNSVLVEKLMLLNRKGRKLLFFGAGKECSRILNNIKFPVELIVDSDEKKEGKKMEEIEIICAKSIKDWFQYFIVVTCRDADEIEDFLQRHGLKKDENYVLAKEYFVYD